MNDAENRFIDALHQFGIDNARQHIEKIDSKMLANLANAANVRNSNLKDFIDKEKEIMSDDAFLEALKNMEVEAEKEPFPTVISDDGLLQKIAERESELAGLKKMTPDEKEIDSCKMNVRVDGFLLDVQKEFERASKKHKKFHSHHEGLAVIWEEFEELKEEVFKKKPDEDNLYDELTQIAAMCLKFYRNLMKD